MVDACVRANILDYLMKLKEELKMTIVFITHDIGLAYYVSDRLFIMHQGKIVEQGRPTKSRLTPKNEHTVSARRYSRHPQAVDRQVSSPALSLS